jgi:hypothetical protein
MPEWRSFRVLWVALIPVLVFPLYGQSSCNNSCPPSSNPCQRAAGRSIETSQCLYTNLDGATCDAQGATGTCSGGQCIASECAGNESYGICDNPVNLTEEGANVGACVEDLCVAAVPYDECVKVGMGRLNCCSDPGCRSSSGAYCSAPRPNDTSCDPSGVEPAGQTGQDGICSDGACIAQTGPCAGLVCRTTPGDPCVRRYCDADAGQCAEWPVDYFPGCVTSDGFAGVCSEGSCYRSFNPDDCNGVVCDDGNSCTDNLCVDLSIAGGFPSCEYRPRETGAPCLDGESGQCFRPTVSCLPVLELCPDGNDAFCNDGNECTANTCEITCRTRVLDDGTSCQNGLGLCRYGVCLPDLCIDRDCDDGNPCTDNNCISPYGICENPTLSTGAPCIGECGQCFFGACQPTITQECSHEPTDPNREFSACGDGNECTYDRCDVCDQCTNPRKPNGTSCNNGNGQCIFGNCSIGG